MLLLLQRRSNGCNSNQGGETDFIESVIIGTLQRGGFKMATSGKIYQKFSIRKIANLPG